MTDAVRTFAEDNAVLRVLGKAPSGMRFRDLAHRTGFEEHDVQRIIDRLRTTYRIHITGGVVQMPRGVYTRKPRTSRAHGDATSAAEATAAEPVKRQRRRRAHRNRDTGGGAASSNGVDYAVVLADLEGRRDRLTALIDELRAMIGEV